MTMNRITLLMLFCAITLSGAVETKPLPESREHEVFSTTIVVTNENDTAVKLARLSATCSCQKQHLKKHFLLPGEQTELEIAIENTNISGPTQQTVWIEWTDPEVEALAIPIHWRVIPNIAVDSIPPQGPFDQRPTSALHRDVYLYITTVHPEEFKKHRKVIMLSTPQNLGPEGLTILQLMYEGALWDWRFQQKTPQQVLLVGTINEQVATMEERLYEEQVILETNHPDKPHITLELQTALTTNRESNPFSHLR